MELTDRLKKVLELGDVTALFPVLKDWPTEELQALVKDVDEYAATVYSAIDRAWATVAFKPEVFVSAELSKSADRIRDEKRMLVLAMASEICSVAFYYLHARGIDTEETEWSQ